MRENTLSDLLGFPLGPVACGIKRRTGGAARLELNHSVVADLLGCSATTLCEKPDSLKLLQLFLSSTAIGSEPPQIIAGGGSELPSSCFTEPSQSLSHHSVNPLFPIEKEPLPLHSNNGS